MGPQGWFGRVQKISPPTGIRSPDCPAHSVAAIPATLSEHIAWMMDAKRPVYVPLGAKSLEGGHFGRAG